MSQDLRILTALPVYNEERHVARVLSRVLEYADNILVVDDGSTDETVREVRKFPSVEWVSHPVNRGYGAGLVTAFDYAREHGYDILVTIDCDGQHEPSLIPGLAASLGNNWDMVSGSRYLEAFDGNSAPPVERRQINATITAELNEMLGLSLTDAFCGFKAYRVPALDDLSISDFGYAMPLQVWVQAVAHRWRISEFPVPLVYLEEERSFGGTLDQARVRLAHYRNVIAVEMARYAAALEATGKVKPAISTAVNLDLGCQV
jgi:glycosyltransferase involved in cell wall biosynthesis